MPVIRCQSLYKVFGISPADLRKDADGVVEPSILEREGVVAAVNNVTLDVSAGEILVVMGLSGSGKSTLVRCISRLIEPSSGSVEIEGHDLLKMNDKELIELRRHKMGMVFQNFALLPHSTALENIAFPLQMRGMKRAECRTCAKNDHTSWTGRQGEQLPERTVGWSATTGRDRPLSRS